MDIGALFSLQQRVHEDGDNQILPNRGGGAWVSWNFSKYVALDTTAFYSPQDDKHAYPQDGGRDLMAVWGIKAGMRRDRLGYFCDGAARGSSSSRGRNTTRMSTRIRRWF